MAGARGPEPGAHGRAALFPPAEGGQHLCACVGRGGPWARHEGNRRRPRLPLCACASLVSSALGGQWCSRHDPDVTRNAALQAVGSPFVPSAVTVTSERERRALPPALAGARKLRCRVLACSHICSFLTLGREFCFPVKKSSINQLRDKRRAPGAAGPGWTSALSVASDCSLSRLCLLSRTGSSRFRFPFSCPAAPPYPPAPPASLSAACPKCLLLPRLALCEALGLASAQGTGPHSLASRVWFLLPPAAAAPPAQVRLRVSWVLLRPFLSSPVSLGATLLPRDVCSCRFPDCLWFPWTTSAPGAFRVWSSARRE